MFNARTALCTIGKAAREGSYCTTITLSSKEQHALTALGYDLSILSYIDDKDEKVFRVSWYAIKKDPVYDL